MSERTIEVSNVKGSSSSDKITPEEIAESRAQKKARRAQIYERGIIGDRLHVDLPADKYGEWVPNNVVDVDRKRSLGFEIDTVHAKNRALHDKGDSASYVGDVVFMICDKEDKEIIDEVRKERYNRVHAPKNGKQAEERNFTSAADPQTVPTAQSRVHTAKGTDITEAIKAASNNQ